MIRNVSISMILLMIGSALSAAGFVQPSDSTKISTLILHDQRQNLDFQYQPGELITLWHHDDSQIDMDSPEKAYGKKVRGYLIETERDSLLIDDTWVQIDHILQITRPGKGERSQLISRRIISVLGWSLLSILLFTLGVLANYYSAFYDSPLIFSPVLMILGVIALLTSFRSLLVRPGVFLKRRFKLIIK